MPGREKRVKCCLQCGRVVQGYFHEAPHGCGLANSIRIATSHHHFYCRCSHEWVEGVKHEQA